MRYWIGLGSNQGDSIKQINIALRMLKAGPEVCRFRVSRLYRSKPWGIEKQPDFINAVARLESSLQPMVLLERMQAIEEKLGRKRQGQRWGPRVIDLDLLLAEDRILHYKELVVPHPRMHLRRFVLVPLEEIDPDLVIPARGRIARLLARLPENGVWPIDPG